MGPLPRLPVERAAHELDFVRAEIRAGRALRVARIGAAGRESAHPRALDHARRAGARTLLADAALPQRVLYFCLAALVYFFPIFSIIDKMPGLGNLRAPDSFWIVAGTFAWCVAAALAVTWSLRQISARSLRLAAACGVVVAAFADNTAYAAHFFRGGMPAGTMESFEASAKSIRESNVPGRIRPFSGRYFYLLLPSMTGRGLSTEAGHHNFMQKQAAILEDSVFRSPSLLWAYFNVAGISHVFADKENGAPSGLDFYRRRLKTIYEDQFFAVFENPSSLFRHSSPHRRRECRVMRKGSSPRSSSRSRKSSNLRSVSASHENSDGFHGSQARKILPVPEWGRAQRVADGMNITISKPSNGWVVFADAWHPDWKASVDGKPAQVLAGVGAMPCVQCRKATGRCASSFVRHGGIRHAA